MVKSALLQATGKNSPIVTVLPPPVVANRAPRSSDIMPAGQLFIDSSTVPDTVYTSLGNGTFAAGGTGLSITGTANQITANTVGTAATLTLPATLVAPGSIAATTSITATLGNITATNGNLSLGTAGNKINIATGANASAGTSDAMIAGSVTVNTTAITANSLVFFATGTLGGVGEPQAYRVSARTPSVSFTIDSSSAGDTSTVNWLIIN